MEVSDTGVGIVPELSTRIFKPFEQRESEAVRQFGGLGLGLALSKATMDAHHGSLIARSEGKDRGATFAAQTCHRPLSATDDLALTLVENSPRGKPRGYL